MNIAQARFTHSRAAPRAEAVAETRVISTRRITESAWRVPLV